MGKINALYIEGYGVKGEAVVGYIYILRCLVKGEAASVVWYYEGEKTKRGVCCRGREELFVET